MTEPPDMIGRPNLSPTAPRATDPRRATRTWGFAWIGLSLALGVHVADEATNDFLSFYNPLVTSLDVPFPTFSFATWMFGLFVGLVVLFSLSPLVFRGASVMVPVSLVFAAVMLVNGLGHLAASLYFDQFVPGVYSSPLLIVTSIYLFVATVRFSRSGP